ncbi:MAG: HlyC/CorC family transporter [Clostridia bacterium]|nr:HlyC/CorC family transporter [Clostridia bacterium]
MIAVDDGPAVSIILFVILIVLSGYFSGTEISLASVNRIHMMSKASKGKRSAKRVLWLLDNFDEALSVLLIGNNVVNIGCATLATAITLHLGAYWVTVATIVATVVIFIFGEILPKSFARSCNEKFAEFASLPLIILMKVLKPVSIAFTALSALVSKPFKAKAEMVVTMTEEELTDIVENISQEDGFDEDRSELMKSALEFSSSTAGEVMTPWEKVEYISVALKTPEILKIVKNSIHSRIPVTDRKGNIKGVLQIRNFFKAYMKNRKNVILASIIDYPYYVDANEPIDDVLTEMSNHRRNLSFVRDNDGDVVGILTVEDILEELVGEIYDENDIGGALGD